MKAAGTATATTTVVLLLLLVRQIDLERRVEGYGGAGEMGRVPTGTGD